MGQRAGNAAEIRSGLEFLSEQRRQRWERKARKAKRRWFAAACRQSGRKKIMGPVLCRFLFMAAALAAAFAIARATAVKETVTSWQEAEASGQKDGWEKEVFGIRIRLKDGQISVFKETEQVIRTPPGD